jgi:hypothetical protein
MQALYDLRSQPRQALLVRAGMEGILEEVSVGTGQQVGSGTILARVANTSRLMARIHVPEAQAGNVDVSQPASITLQDRSYAAKVVRVDPNVQNGTVSIDLKFADPQPHEARTDLSATGAIEVEKIPSTTYVNGRSRHVPARRFPCSSFRTMASKLAASTQFSAASRPTACKSSKDSAPAIRSSSQTCPTGAATRASSRSSGSGLRRSRCSVSVGRVRPLHFLTRQIAANKKCRLNFLVHYAS